MSSSSPWLSWPQGFQANFSLSWNTRVVAPPACSGLRARICCYCHTQVWRSEWPVGLLHLIHVFWRGNHSILADPVWQPISIWTEWRTGPTYRKYWKPAERGSNSLSMLWTQKYSVACRKKHILKAVCSMICCRGWSNIQTVVYDGCRQVLTAEYNSSLLNNPCLSTVPVKIGAVLAFWF